MVRAPLVVLVALAVATALGTAGLSAAHLETESFAVGRKLAEAAFGEVEREPEPPMLVRHRELVCSPPLTARQVREPAAAKGAQKKRGSRDTSKSRSPSQSSPASKSVSDVVVSEATVRSWIAQRAAPPAAVFVRADADRPAGLRLAGASRFGVGVHDGDVLTAVAGRAVSSVSDVVSAVVGAYARGERRISARLYRGASRYSLTVVLPAAQGARR